MLPKTIGVAAVVAAAVLSSACKTGPKYIRPDVQAPQAYKEQAPNTFKNTPFRPAQPSEGAPRGKWWEIFNDPQLTALEEQVDINNQNIKVVEAQYRQAKALVRQARANLFPTVGGTASVVNIHQPKLFSNSNGFNEFTLQPAQASWDTDVFGRLRKTVDADIANAQVTAADLANARLAAQGQLALAYFQLRGNDAERQLLESTTVAYQRNLDLTRNRFNGGVASAEDVAQAETQLQTTTAQAIDLGVLRAQYEHAIALLTGKAASEFSIPISPLTAVPPPIPVGLPSELLERRPDIAANERAVAAANAQIGIAQAAYFPDITLSAAAGLESTKFVDWFTWPSRLWSLGPSITETFLDFGRRKAVTQQAQAAYEAAVATYRENVLAAFQQVEDNLAALGVLARELDVEHAAVTAAQRALSLSTDRYKGGVISYLDVVTQQTALLSNQVAEVGIVTRRMTSAVSLIQALGGGWTAAEMPTAHDIVATNKKAPQPPPSLADAKQVAQKQQP